MFGLKLPKHNCDGTPLEFEARIPLKHQTSLGILFGDIERWSLIVWFSSLISGILESYGGRRILSTVGSGGPVLYYPAGMAC